LRLTSCRCRAPGIPCKRRPRRSRWSGMAGSSGWPARAEEGRRARVDRDWPTRLISSRIVGQIRRIGAPVEATFSSPRGVIGARLVGRGRTSPRSGRSGPQPVRYIRALRGGGSAGGNPRPDHRRAISSRLSSRRLVANKAGRRRVVGSQQATHAEPDGIHLVESPASASTCGSRPYHAIRATNPVKKTSPRPATLGAADRDGGQSEVGVR